MLPFKEMKDKNGKITSIKTNLRGARLLTESKLNKGSAFTREERALFGLTGKLPYHIENMESQAARYYRRYQDLPNNIAKNVFLNDLKQYNNTLFYHLAMEHLEEMLPIVYTPTIGDAVEAFSYEFNRPQGLYFSYPDRHHFSDILKERKVKDIDLITVSDGEGVLGIGDWGIGGMDICIGKLMVYTLVGGVNPRRVLPIQFDVGTNNKKLLDDPMYLGWRHERITGSDYDEFIDLAVSAIRGAFPDVFLHWEDFGRENARRNLNRYRDKMCTFNDDMQGTGATALACVLSALQAIGETLKDQRIVFFGAGTAGVGIADQICVQMVKDGLTQEEAYQRFWLIDRPGLLTDDMTNLMPFQKPYARPKQAIQDWDLQNNNNIGLFDVVKNIKPTILIGVSTVHGAFSKPIVEMMAAQVEHPIIFPMSNPTSKSEAIPEDLIAWTKGKALIATGSPFSPITYNGKTMRISQANNAFIFPGLGLGVISVKAKRITDSMIFAAANALSLCSPARKDTSAPILPDIANSQAISRKIAFAVAEQAIKEGVANITGDIDLKALIDANFWGPEYLPYQLEESL